MRFNLRFPCEIFFLSAFFLAHINLVRCWNWVFIFFIYIVMRLIWLTVVSKWKVRYEIIEKCLLKDFFKRKMALKGFIFFCLLFWYIESSVRPMHCLFQMCDFILKTISLNVNWFNKYFIEMLMKKNVHVHIDREATA